MRRQRARAVFLLLVLGLAGVAILLSWPAREPAGEVAWWQPDTSAPVPVLAPRALTGGRLRAVAIFDAGGDERPDLFLAGYASDFLASQLPRGWRGQELDSAGATRAVLAADLNRDGWRDLLTGGDQGLRLWLNDGRGRYLDAVAPAGGAGATTALAAADVNRDGWTDLLVARTPGPVQLWLHDGAGEPGGPPHYRESAAESGITGGLDATSAVLADLDGDGDADLVLAGAAAGIEVYANDGRGRFTRMPFAPDAQGNWRALAVADFDQDGDLDLFVGAGPPESLAWLPQAWWSRGPGVRHVLARNDGNFVFHDLAAEAGLAAAAPASGAAWLDADNDGAVELLLAGPTGLTLWRAQTEAPAWLASRVPGPAPAQSVAVGDIDHNGYPDLVVRGPRGEVTVAMHNGGPNHWLAVRLRGRGHYPVQGARIEVATRDGMRISGQVLSGAGAGVEQFDALLFGIGRRAEIQGVSVFWPSGKFTRLERNNLDRYIGFVEPSDASGGRNVWLREPVLEALKSARPQRKRLQCP